MDLSSDKKYTISDSEISSSEDGGTHTQIHYEFEEAVNDLGELTKELNLQIY